MKVELHDIHKVFGAVRANDGVRLTVDAGTIHGILGENGAGKSTLMKILAGLIPRTSGTIQIDGLPTDYRSPGQAAGLGIGMLYQEPLDFPAFRVLDNFMLGLDRSASRRGIRRRLMDLADTLAFRVDPDQQVSGLTVGERQQLEILRLLELGARVLILDEPTTGISTDQKETLFSALRALTRSGKSVIFVSHKLDDVQMLCDTVTVLRQGRCVGQMERPFDTAGLLAMMFGTAPEPPAACRLEAGDEVLMMKDVSAPGGRAGLSGCTVTTREKEIVGLAGLEGSGQGVFLKAAAGLQRPRTGQICIRERNLTGDTYHRYHDSGVAYLPTDRLQEGLINGLTIAEHTVLKDRDARFMVPRRRSVALARKKITDYRVIGEPDADVAALSGGNQQRLMLSFLPAAPSLLLLENPTRGLDVESATWVWNHLQTLGRRGACIIFSSSELDEIMTVANRILVFFDGRIIKDTPSEQTTLQELGHAIAGQV